MKTMMKLKQLMAICVALFTFSSCLESEDPAFQIVPASAFVYQVTENLGSDEQPEYSARYMPYFQIYSNYQMSQCLCTSSNGNVVLMSPVSNSQNLMYASSSINYSTEYPAGTYTFSATNAEGEQASYTVTISNVEKTLGYINVTELKYENGKITAKWDKVDNATAYAVAIGKSGDILPLYAKEFETYPESGVEFEFSNETEKLESGTYKLYVVAYLISNNQLQIMSPSQEYETITIQ